MLFSVVIFMLSVPGDASDVTRDFFGDIFRMRDCHNGSRCDNGGRRPALQVPGRPCYCQCAPTHLSFREDKKQCVKDIKECYMSVFYRPFTVEAIPLVYLPTSGQLVHPDAHLSLSMRRNFEGGMAKCRVTVSQYLTKDGWRTLTKADGTGGSMFGLFTDANKTYLQFLGTPNDRRMLQQHMVLIRLLCIIPQYPAFETCVAIRVGWVPGVENIEDISSPSNKANMMVVGLSLGVLALVYIFAVLVYLKIRRQMIAKQKATADQEAKLQSLEENPDKVSNLHCLEPSSRLELYHSTTMGRQKSGKKASRKNYDPWNELSSIVETYNRTWTDRMGQHSSEFRAQDFKLQPEFFEPEFMASPPHEVLEYLERLQNSITFARHRMRTCYRYQPTLNGIPEDDYFYQEMEKMDTQNKEVRTTPDGGSASSTASLQEPPEQKTTSCLKGLPKVPPRKPKRKSVVEKSECSVESAQNSDQEQKEIQKAMNTLNDTLEALEYDMYKQEMMNQISDTETANYSCQNSTIIDFDDFETSSCSSLSAATVLGRDAKRLSDISKCSQYIEQNLSEEFSTFSNSTFSLNVAMRGLFHNGNKANSNLGSENSNPNSRCSSQAGYLSQAEEISAKGSKIDSRMEVNGKNNRCGNTVRDEQPDIRNIRQESPTDNGSNPLVGNNDHASTSSETCMESECILNENLDFKNNISTNHFENGAINKSVNYKEHKYFGQLNMQSKQDSNTLVSQKENRQKVVHSPDCTENNQEYISSSDERKMHENRSSQIHQDEKECSSSSDEEHARNINTPNTEENTDTNINLFSSQNCNQKDKRTRFRDSTYRSSSSTKSSDSDCENNVSKVTENEGTEIDNLNKQSSLINKHNSIEEKSEDNISASDQEIVERTETTPEPQTDHQTVDILNKEINTSNLISVSKTRSTKTKRSSIRKENRNLSDSDSNSLKKSSSNESVNTIATDMTVDSLDSRCTTPGHPSPTQSLMEMWINKLVSTSVPYSKSRRKAKKKLILPEDEIESWEHVCQKHKDPCPMPDINDSEPNLIDKLAHYSSKTMAGCDVAGYFQSLKQDVLKEHLKQWLNSNHQSKKCKKSSSVESNIECSHKRPLVNGQEINLIAENGMHLSTNNLLESICGIDLKKQENGFVADSLESNSDKNLKPNVNIYFGGIKEIKE